MNDEIEVRVPGSPKRFHLNCWSVSGLESCVTVRVDDSVRYAFDIGHATRASIMCDHVFVTHGHIDHCGALPKHVSQRELRSRPPSTYYCPPDIEESLLTICQGFAAMNEGYINKPLSPSRKSVASPVGQDIPLSHGRVARPFRTYHRVASQGYLIYAHTRTRITEYMHLSGPEIGEYMAQGIQVWENKHLPEIAYTGDTTFDTFLDPDNADLLRSSILITEATYIDDRQPAEKARQRGHIHLQDIAKNAELFRHIGALVLVHLSDRYTSGQAQHWVRRLLPQWLLNKTWVPMLMKDMEGGYTY
ncbi:uncharacterized protein LOC129594472 [Paramacrobiotus metropolitanus]|uniref:uncharacterized protein LOC129594472 n=1 Tax=Paramacrobiotus metropolitanus TaxID=2943436 RepID=UPI0024461398|nr:uncharacterized protein LOC129594472 [Paramacrobiotus metropolitanus]